MSTSISASVNAMAAGVVNNAPSITTEQIAETIANWDVRACGQRVFVARIQHETTRGGIVIPEQWRESQCDGVVVSAGPMAYVNDVEPAGDEEREARRWMSPDELDCATRRFLKPGDRITWGKWSGDTISRKNTVKKGLDTLMVMNADDLIGTPEEK